MPISTLKIHQREKVVWTRISGRLALNFVIKDDDRELKNVVSRAKLGDKDAFATIVNALDRRVLTACNRACYGHHEFEDVATEVWLGVWERIPTFEGTTVQDILRLAFSIVKFRSIDFHRRRLRQPGQLHADEDGSTDEPVSSDVNPLNKLILREESEAIKNCIESQADPESLTTWRMKKMEGMSYEEIMDNLSIQIGTVGSRINRVEKIVAGCMEGRGL